MRALEENSLDGLWMISGAGLAFDDLLMGFDVGKKRIPSVYNTETRNPYSGEQAVYPALPPGSAGFFRRILQQHLHFLRVEQGVAAGFEIAEPEGADADTQQLRHLIAERFEHH